MFLEWNLLRNPIYSHKEWSVKDACVEYKDGTFFLFFSAFYRDRGKIRSHVVEISTKDWKTFSEPILTLDGREENWTGMASPNISKIDENYVLTFNSWGTRHPNKRTNNLFHVTSKDLINWSEMKQVARNLTEEIRAIDIAIAFENNMYYLMFKDRDFKRIKKIDRARIAVSNHLDDDFEYIENGFARFYLKDRQENKKTHENYQFLKIDGTWYLLSTDYMPHEPFIYHIGGSGSGENDMDWLTWENGYKLAIKQEKFNTYHLANAGFLADWRRHDGNFYFIYAGNTEVRSFARRGNNKLGLSRSTSLKDYHPP